MAETIPKLETKNALNLIIEIKETQRELETPVIELRLGLHYPCYEDGVAFFRHKFSDMELHETIKNYELDRVVSAVYNYGQNIVSSLHSETKQMQEYFKYQVGLIKEIGNRLNVSQLRLLGGNGILF